MVDTIHVARDAVTPQFENELQLRVQALAAQRLQLRAAVEEIQKRWEASAKAFPPGSSADAYGTAFSEVIEVVECPKCEELEDSFRALQAAAQRPEIEQHAAGSRWYTEDPKAAATAVITGLWVTDGHKRDDRIKASLAMSGPWLAQAPAPRWRESALCVQISSTHAGQGLRPLAEAGGRMAVSLAPRYYKKAPHIRPHAADQPNVAAYTVVYTFAVTSVAISEALDVLCPHEPNNKTLTAQLHPVLLGMPAVLKGLIDGDGCAPRGSVRAE
jgi:hypothetical protein